MATRRRRTAQLSQRLQEDARATLRAILDEYSEHFRKPPHISFYNRASNEGLHVFIADCDGTIRNITNELRRAAGIRLSERGEGYSPYRGIVVGVTFQSASQNLRDIFNTALPDYPGEIMVQEI